VLASDGCVRAARLSRPPVREICRARRVRRRRNPAPRFGAPARSWSHTEWMQTLWQDVRVGLRMLRRASFVAISFYRLGIDPGRRHGDRHLCADLRHVAAPLALSLAMGVQLCAECGPAACKIANLFSAVYAKYPSDNPLLQMNYLSSSGTTLFTGRPTIVTVR
jgi:hypothetical protein